MHTLVFLLSMSGSLAAQDDWPNVGNDKGAMRYSRLAQIHRGNVARLEPALTFHTGGLDPAVRNSAIQCTPIVIGGVMYITSPDTQVIALDAGKGRELWRFDPKRTKHRHLHNRGIAYWREDRAAGATRILFATPDGLLYSLDARTGAPDAQFGKDGVVDLRVGVERDLSSLVYGVTSAPAVFEDLVILGFSLDEDFVGGPGDVRAFDVRTGKERWRFHTVPRPTESGHATWEAIAPTGTPNLGGTIVTAGGLVFVGATMDEKFRAFDSATGKLLWEHKLPFGGYATPSTYSVGGRQFVVIAAGGGGKLGTRSGDAFVAFAVP